MSADELAIAAIVFVAAFTQGVIGFGFGLVVMAVLPRLLALETAVPFVAVYGVAVAAMIFLRYRRHAPLREIWPMVLGSVFGLPLGILALRDLDPDPCIRALGVFIVLFVVQAAWPRRVPDHEKRPVPRGWAAPAGFVAGVFGGAFAMGGPPVIAYCAGRRFSPATFKGVLQGFFATNTLVMVAMLGYAGMLSGEVLRLNLWLAPAVPLGIWVGSRYGDRLNPRLFRRIVLTALLGLGLLYAIGGR